MHEDLGVMFIRLFHKIGYTSDIDDLVKKANEHYAAGLHAYRNQDWDKAIDFFNAALKISPDYGPSNTMIDRCNKFKSNPPGKTWNGSYTITTK